MIKVNLLSPEQRSLTAAILAFQDAQYNRPFSARHPELGKMVNCQVCGTRHRQNERKCEQVFTNRAGDYELFRENEAGELVPAFRTCIDPDSKPTPRQVVGRAAFAKKRFNPHPNKYKLQLVERVRTVFDYELTNYELGTKEQFETKLKRARIVAARQLRRKWELQDRAVRRRQDMSRRINRGLAC